MSIRTTLFALALLLSWSGAWLGTAPALADAASDIRGVIESQLDAFQRDDGATAFSFASPSIRQRFRTAEIFMQMVQTGYPQVYRPQAVEFRGLDLSGDRAVQRLFVIGPDGDGALALCFMELQASGQWKIDGVQLQRVPETSA